MTPRLGSLLVACAWVVVGPVYAQTPESISVPAAALEALGIPHDTHRALALSRAIRALHESSTSNEPRVAEFRRLLEAVDRRAPANDPVRNAPNTFDVPLPLSADIWARYVFRRDIPAERLFDAIVRSRDASLLYYGLQAMTPDTRAYIANTPDLVEWLRGRAAAVAAFGGSLRIGRDGRVRVPGGVEAEALWERLTGERLSEPDRFARALFSRDGGRLGYFAEALWALDPARIRFAVGPTTTESERYTRFFALYEVFARTDPFWSISNAPFNRPSYDAALLLSVVAVSQDGRLAAPAHRRLWQQAFSSSELPADGDRQLRDASADGIADAAFLAGLLAGKLPRERRTVIERIAFAQRIFAEAADAELQDVLIALRAHGRFPAALATVERIGIRTPAVYSRVARHAAALDAIGLPDVLPLLTQFQGALAMVERLARTGAVLHPVREELVLSLSTVPLENRRYAGGIAEWLRVGLLAALPHSATDAGEDRLLAAIVERFEIPRDSFEWEGQRYAFDVERLIRDLRSRRARQPVNSIDRLLALYTHAVGLSGPATLEEIRARTEALARDAGGIVSAHPWPEAPSAATDVSRAIERALRDLSGIRREQDVSRAARAVVPVVDALDSLLGQSLVALAYAAVPAESGRAAAVDIFHRHDFGLTKTIGVVRQPATWQRPVRGSERADGDAVTGALLGLDLALARDRLRRLAADMLPRAPRLNANDQRAMAETVALLNPREMDDARGHEIADTIRRGRERVRQAAASVDRLDALAEEAHLGPDRRAALPWTMRHDAAGALSLFSLADLFRLGAGLPSAAHAWGTSHERLVGCYCIRFPEGAGRDSAAGRTETGQLTAWIPDLNLRIATALSELRAPAALFPGVMALATQDFMDGVPMVHADDWSAVAGYVASISPDRIEDYVSAVVAAGPFRAIDDEGSR